MLFALLVLFSAFLIEGIGSYVSVIGLSSLFSANPIIIALAIALDIGKIVTVSFLYKHWKNVNWLMKSYMSIAAVVLMIITSAGAFGFLSGEFQKAIADTSSQNVVMATLTDEQGRLQLRKNEIDKQISQLKTDNVKGRTQLMRQFGPEVGRINKRLEEIDKELPKLKVESIKKNVEVGPIIYVAEAFHTTPEQAVKWVILIIIFVFDPLAVALLIAGNYLLELRKQQKEIPIQPVTAEAVVQQLPIISVEAVVQEVEEQPKETPASAPLVEEPVKTVDESLEVIKDEIEELVVEEIVAEEVVDNLANITEEVKVAEEIITPISIEEIVEEIEHTISTINEQPAKLSAAPEVPVLDIISEEHPDREVITLEQITKQPVYRSALEDIDASQGDIQTDEDDRERSMKNIFTIYRG